MVKGYPNFKFIPLRLLISSEFLNVRGVAASYLYKNQHIEFNFENIQLFVLLDFLQSRSCPGLFWYDGCGVWIGLIDTVGDNQNYEWSANFPGK